MRVCVCECVGVVVPQEFVKFDREAAADKQRVFIQINMTTVFNSLYKKG